MQDKDRNVNEIMSNGQSRSNKLKEKIQKWKKEGDQITNCNGTIYIGE